MIKDEFDCRINIKRKLTIYINIYDTCEGKKEEATNDMILHRFLSSRLGPFDTSPRSMESI